MLGSLGALFNGVLLVNLVVALFALVAIESSSQSLGRTYAVLLFCAILLDIGWFILFSQSIWYAVLGSTATYSFTLLNFIDVNSSCLLAVNTIIDEQ